MAPSTFASAAASGGNSNSPRLDTANEWSRRPNGATQTFRRSSAAVTISSNPPTNRNSTDAANVGVYVPPHRNGTIVDTRYSKQQMLDLFRSQQDGSHLQNGLSDLFIDGWDPESTNGGPHSPWSRRDEQKESQAGAEICWDRHGNAQPLWLRDLTAEEKELFSSVNSPIKPQTANSSKDPVARETGGRKASVSGVPNTPGGYNVTSPTSRPNPRRRDTNEAYPFPSTSSSGMGRFSRDESHNTANAPASLLRRRTETTKELQEDELDKSVKPETTSSFAGLKRTATGGLGSNGAWGGSPNTAFSPIGGAFGSFALPSASASTAGDKRPGNLGGARGESRFKGLMKDSIEPSSGPNKEPASLAGLGQTFDNQRLQTHVDLDDDEVPDVMTGSAALQGADDESPPRARTTGRFAGIGSRLSQDTNPSHDLSHQTPHRPGAAQPDLTSPTDTNPYQSPGNETEPSEPLGSQQQSLPGLGGFTTESGHNLSSLMGLGAQRLAGHESVDRSQNSSVSNKPAMSHITSLPGLGSNAGWPSAQPTAGTPTRERLAGGNFGSAFGDGIFSPVEQPSGLGFPTGFGNASGLGNLGRSSRLTSFMQSSGQEQHRSQELVGLGDASSDAFAQPVSSNRGRNAFNAQSMAQSAHNEHHFRNLRAPVDDYIGNHANVDASASPNLGSDSSAAMGPPGAVGQRNAQNPPRQGSVNSTGSGPHAPQIRQMVMPDRMRWLYKDPSGSAQGPWSGLEMHDWYKAGFFTPELLIRKVEDLEFEPLAQLIRRIGNSREPFLVPQIGVPHDPPASARGWSATGGPSTAGGIQPPFPNSFPSFGTTLTAEQQNALERRKQEEQFLMARQKEQLAQRQYGMNMQMHAPFHAGAAFQPPLNHQPSSQSLHSQPSLSNLGSAAGFAGGSNQPISGLGDYRSIPGANLSSLNASNEHQQNAPETDMAAMMGRMNIGRGDHGSVTGLNVSGLDNNHSQQVTAMLNERARLEREQAESESHQQDHDAAFGTTDRLRQFRELHSAEEDHHQHAEGAESNATRDLSESERQSITQQVQAAVASKGSQPVAWARVDPHTMQPVIPPPQSSSPMPAPVAQRKHNPAESLNAGSRSHSQTPTTDTASASIAPWAKELVEGPKAQSLKEIQEVEAKKAAQREEIAAAARRAALEKELLAQQSIAPPAPGLPSTSNWAASPSAVPSSASVWAKSNSSKTVPTTSGKKTLQQIQKEEEARKQRVANTQTVAASGASGTTQSLSSGKRYADLASKVNAAPSTPNAAWTTVGASGKVKTPVPAAPARSVSGSVAMGSQPATTAKAKQPMRSTTLGSSRIGQSDANEEFKKWAVKELASHLNKGIDVESFVDNLLAVGLDRDILIEAVHFQSQTIDSRHFAEEFIRRRKLADKGVIAADSTPPLPTATTGAMTGGWNEVTKKGPQVSQEPAQGLNNFKVVPSKKKSKK